MEFPVPPDKFIETLGVGLTITDECHEVLHQVVRRAIMLNSPKNIYLSATLEPPSDIIEKVYCNIFPMKDRFTEFENNQHIVVNSVRYNANDPDKIKCIGPMGYSHFMFEDSIAKIPSLLNNYFEMIYNLMEKDYLANRREGLKMLVFFSTVRMCGLFADYLKSKLDESISVSIYTADEPESVLKEFEIIVTTPKSCGTGKDIPNLYCSIMTPAIASKALSQQILGRTRPIKLYPELDPKFYYLSCMDIEKHRDYDIGHIKDFSNKSKAIDVIHLPVYI
jgi:superfamily II DNA or RNA helicase